MKRSTLAALCSLLAALPALADAGEKIGGFELSANVAMTSDYMWRGVSQNDEDMALQGGFDVTHETGFYAGVWGSPVDFSDGDEANMEVDLYGGFAYTFENGIGIDLGVIHYDYPGARDVLEYDFEEYYVGLSYGWENLAASAKYSYSSDFFGSTTDASASYLEGELAYTFPIGVTLAGHMGHSSGDAFDNTVGNPDNYDDYKISLSGELKGFGLEAAWVGVDSDGKTLYNRLADDRLVFTVSRAF